VTSPHLDGGLDGTPVRVRSRLPSVAVLMAFAVVAALVASLTRGHLSEALLRYVGERLNLLASYLAAPHMLDGGRLYVFALVGGLVTSVSPCILAMLPMNLSYIGALRHRSRAEAVWRATLFAGGVAAVNTVLGLASSLFFAVFVQFRAEVDIAVGALTVVAALWMGGLLRFSAPNVVKAIPQGMGPVAVGVACGLVTSPCSSPVLFAVLTAASRDGSPLRATAAMTLYSIGYTTVVWLASASAGVLAASRRFATTAGLITRLSAFALGAIGVGAVAYGTALLRQ
jgi:cytochrome c-type biogenesis protein